MIVNVFLVILQNKWYRVLFYSESYKSDSIRNRIADKYSYSTFVRLVLITLQSVSFSSSILFRQIFVRSIIVVDIHFHVYNSFTWIYKMLLNKIFPPLEVHTHAGVGDPLPLVKRFLLCRILFRQNQVSNSLPSE